MPSAETVLADLDLGEQWDVLEAADVVRQAVGPGHEPGELTDSVVDLRRR